MPKTLITLVLYSYSKEHKPGVQSIMSSKSLNDFGALFYSFIDNCHKIEKLK